MIYKNQLHIIFLQVLVLLCLGCSSKGKSKKNKPSEKPNIIYIMADDLTTQAISAYGGIYKDIAPTPNMDKVAKEGMLFQDVLLLSQLLTVFQLVSLLGYNVKRLVL